MLYCCAHYQPCLSMLNFIDKAYQCLPSLSIINCTHSQTCFSVLIFTDKAHNSVLTFTEHNQRMRLPRNPSTSLLRNRPKNIPFPFIPISIPCFINVYTYYPPFVCHHTKQKKRKKTTPPSLKETSKMRIFAFRVPLCSETGPATVVVIAMNAMFVAAAVALQK